MNVERKKTLEMIQFMRFNKTCDHQNVGELSFAGATRRGELDSDHQNIGELSYTDVGRCGRLIEHDLLGLGDLYHL